MDEAELARLMFDRDGALTPAGEDEWRRWLAQSEARADRVRWRWTWGSLAALVLGLLALFFLTDWPWQWITGMGVGLVATTFLVAALVRMNVLADSLRSFQRRELVLREIAMLDDEAFDQARRHLPAQRRPREVKKAARKGVAGHFGFS